MCPKTFVLKSLTALMCTVRRKKMTVHLDLSMDQRE